MGRRRLPSLPSSAVQQQILQQNYFQGLTFASTSAQQRQQPIIPSLSYQAPQTSSSAIFDGISQDNLNLINRRHSSFITTPSTSTTHPITYYTSYAPEKCDAAVGTNGQEPDYFSEIQQKKDETFFVDLQQNQQTLLNKSAQLYGRCYPGSTLDHLSLTASVIPGATFRSQEEISPKFQKKQSSYSRSLGSLLMQPLNIPTSASTSPSSSILKSVKPLLSSSLASSPWKNTATTTKVAQKQQKPIINNAEQRATQETICQLMFKKELREALTKRREELDTCEIEARHRQYLIDRWLRNGGDLLLSSTGASSLPIRPSELDSIPNVVKCSLPKDLIAGARVVPSTLKKQQKTAIPHYGLPSTSEQHQRIGIAHSVACQANVEDSSSLPTFSTTTLPNQTHKKFLSKDYGSNTKREEINKRLQQQTIKRSIDARDACTQTALCAETQTDPSVEIDDAVNGLSGQERMWTSEEKLGRYSNFLSLFLEFRKHF